MDEFEFINIMEKKKKEHADFVKDLKKRDVFYDIKKHITQKNLFIFYGLRGIGKSTTLYQILNNSEAMFIDGTTLNYYKLGLVEVINEYIKHNKSNILLIDEITELKDWSKALKVLYDNYNLSIIATGSSAIGISIKNKEIIRRAIIKEIPPLTFREYLRLKYDKNFNISTKEIFLSEPKDGYIKAQTIFLKFPDLSKEFNEYLKFGFPLSFERPIEYTSETILSKIIVDDFPGISGFNIEVSNIAKGIVNILALSSPDVISLSTFSNSLDCSKTTVSNILNAFVLSSLLIPILSDKQSSVKIRKEPKYLFSSPAIRYGLALKLVEKPDIGLLREDFFVSSFKYTDFKIEYLSGLKKHPDYLIKYKEKRIMVEIGGPSKTTKQLKKGILLIDNYKIDYKDEILILPLYFAGFL
ncbi:MAG: AAA family ATPase [Candidatus Micrarchaeia archaeon]|jgi:hypothetical protein